MDCSRKKNGFEWVMKLLTHLELEKPTGHAMAPHNTEKGKWDGADPTPQHKAQEERFYFSCWTSIRKHKASPNKVISLFAKHTCKKCNQKCWALPFQSLDQTQSCHQSQFPAFCSQFAQANSANSTNSSTKTSSTILYFSFFIPNFQLFCTVQVKHVKPGFAIGWKLKKEEQVKNKIHKTIKDRTWHTKLQQSPVHHFCLYPPAQELHSPQKSTAEGGFSPSSNSIHKSVRSRVLQISACWADENTQVFSTGWVAFRWKPFWRESLDTGGAGISVWSRGVIINVSEMSICPANPSAPL